MAWAGAVVMIKDDGCREIKVNVGLL